MIAEYYQLESTAVLAKARKLLSTYRLNSEIAVRIGEPAKTIVKVASRSRCSEIVTGTRGLGTLSGLLLGSVTTKVIHLTCMPVTAVP